MSSSSVILPVNDDDGDRDEDERMHDVDDEMQADEPPAEPPNATAVVIINQVISKLGVHGFDMTHISCTSAR